jgi:hypothetical protein
MSLLLHSPDFWIGFASCFVLLALLVIAFLLSVVPELRQSLSWPQLLGHPMPSPAPRVSRARLGRLERADARRWPHDDYAANEEGELRPADWRRDASPLPWDQARHTGGEL